jgi:hypothetical protein
MFTGETARKDCVHSITGEIVDQRAGVDQDVGSLRKVAADEIRVVAGIHRLG